MGMDEDFRELQRKALEVVLEGHLKPNIYLSALAGRIITAVETPEIILEMEE